MIIKDVYEDAGKSGKSIEGRPAFTRLLNDIKNGLQIDYIMVYKLSRFGRNAADVLNSLELIQAYGINLISVEEGIDSSQTSGKLLITMLSAVSEIEREYADNADALFEVAGIYAANARYEEALDRYAKVEAIYKVNHNDHICLDHLHAQALIYEIIGKIEEAIKYVDLQIQFCKDEWNITEGSEIDYLENEKKRLIDKLKLD